MGIDAGTRVAVTGAARGIGRAVAQRFAAAGAHVTVVDRDGTAAEAAAASIDGAVAATVDITDNAAVEAFFAEAPEAYQVVVANAGIPGPHCRFVDVDPAQWRQVLDVNLTGTFQTIRAAARRMLADAVPGRIVVTASVAGLQPTVDGSPYAASKWGVVGLLKSAALELAPHGILVNGVCPGDVDTDLLGGLVDDGAFHGPLGRLAQVDEIAGAYLWLAGPDARYMVGETVVIDGGLASSALMH